MPTLTRNGILGEPFTSQAFINDFIVVTELTKLFNASLLVAANTTVTSAIKIGSKKTHS